MNTKDHLPSGRTDRTHPKRIWAGISLLLIVSLACNLPFSKKQPSNLQATPTTSAKPAELENLPPTVVETSPLQGSILPLKGGISLTFDQAMERESVEAAINLEPAYSGRFEWEDDATVRFIPDQPLSPDTPVIVSIAGTARAKNGLALLRAQDFAFQTAGDLRIAEQIPGKGLREVDPASSIAVTFNQPVAPIGEDESSLPAGFTIEPSAQGSGSWLNSSTYLFKPEVSLGGGVTYTINVNPELTSLAGSSLASDEKLTWTFQTAAPKVSQVVPESGSTVWLDEEFYVFFNQAMDTASVEQNLRLEDASGKLWPVNFKWEDGDRKVTLTPVSVLPRDIDLRLILKSEAHSRGGVEIGVGTAKSYRTIGALAVRATTPAYIEDMNTYSGHGSFQVEFNAPLAVGQNLEELVKITPEPVDFSSIPSRGGTYLFNSGFYESGIEYKLTISNELKDKWGGSLNQVFERSFQVAIPEARLNIPMAWPSEHVLFLPSSEKSVQATSTSIKRLDIRSTQVEVKQMVQAIDNDVDPTAFTPDKTWSQTIPAPVSTSKTIEIGLSPDGSALAPGIYGYTIDSPDFDRPTDSIHFWLVVSRVQLALKVNQNEAFIWAADIQTLTPLAGKRITVYDHQFNMVGSGETNSDGIARVKFTSSVEAYRTVVAVIGEPGEADFSAGYSFWDEGIQPWNYDLTYTYSLLDLKTYFLTDRPIYRPGQTVYFNGILRKTLDARYTDPEIETFKVKVYGDYEYESGKQPLITTIDLPVSNNGTVSGEFVLPEDAQPGTYSIQTEFQEYSYLYLVQFKVAEYRKPEIDLKVGFDKSEYRRGEDLRVSVDSAYFFGAPASDAKISWSLYARDDYFDLPDGYLTGLVDTSWLEPGWHFGMPNPLGNNIASGEGRTDAVGSLALTFTAAQLEDWLNDQGSVTLTLEATLVDESNMPVSNRAAVQQHPADFYIGIRPDQWEQSAGMPLGFAVQTAGWDKQPSGPHTLTAAFQKVVWKADYISAEWGEIIYNKEVTPISSSEFRTDASGRARLEFTPEQPGIYQLDVTGEGALTQRLFWVGGKGSAPWPTLPNQHLRLEADKQDYAPGQTAKIFIPNPYEGGALALVTVERSNVLRSQVIEIGAASQMVDIELEEDDAPNVYVSVLVIGSQDGKPDFRQGYLELKVDPELLELQVDLIPEEDHLEPGKTARAEIRVRDSQGNPVQGEFSVAVVDKAIFALAESNVENISEAFYGEQPLRVRSSTSLAAYAGRIPLEPPAMGGGGGGGAAQYVQLRENFQDTAYWQAAIETDRSGRAQIEFLVPDNLTTWVMTVRGATRDTKVGETTANLVVTKDLLVRPVVPRFLVAGDRVKLAVVVHNNTDQSFAAQVSLSVKGVRLENPDQAQQLIRLAAKSSQRVDWWVNVQNAGQAELVFSAEGGGLQDASKPAQGALPILHYSTPASFLTNGMMAEGGERLEIVNLPRSYTPTGGTLSIEMSTTLAGTVLSGLKAMDAYPLDFTEPVLSRLFANLSVYNLLRDAEIESPDLEGKLQTEIRSGLDQLLGLQNTDGGWGYMADAQSDLDLTGYALLVLSNASDAGFFIDETRFASAQEYVSGGLFAAKIGGVTWELDRLTLLQYGLKQSGFERSRTSELYQVRDQLSPWAAALLALSMDKADTERIRVILSDLQASAIRSATGAYWQERSQELWRHVNPLATTAIVIYALAERDPASELLTEAVRYLSLHRRANGCWDSSYDSAWSVQALGSVLRATGELKADFAYSASLNGQPLASGQASGMSSQPVQATADISNLLTDHGNALRFKREDGAGRLYYRAFLQLDAPVESVRAVDKGIAIERSYRKAGAGCGETACPPIREIQLGQPAPVVDVQVAITLQNDMYDLIVEDFIPAGAEIIDLRLLTSQLGAPQSTIGALRRFDMLEDGWGWWYFSSPRVFDDHIRWVASYVPAGTYILRYSLQPLQAGEFRVLPAHAYAYYFPDVEGRSAGMVFTIKE